MNENNDTKCRKRFEKLNGNQPAGVARSGGIEEREFGRGENLGDVSGAEWTKENRKAKEQPEKSGFRGGEVCSIKMAPRVSSYIDKRDATDTARG